MNEEEHTEYHKRLLGIISIILMLLFGGATFFHYVEKWRYLDALYFATATMTTVGYGDITPQTDLGKIFTIIYIFMAVSMALYGLTLLAAHFVDIREEFWLGKMKSIGTRIKMNPTRGILKKLRSSLNYNSEDLAGNYDYASKSEKPNKKR